MKHLPYILPLLLLGACGADIQPEEPATPREIHERVLVMDSHLDTPANFSKPDFDILADNVQTRQSGLLFNSLPLRVAARPEGAACQTNDNTNSSIS